MANHVLPEKYLSILACPYCRAGVIQENDRLRCTHCQKFFPIKNGIPDMLPYEDISLEFQTSIDSWNKEWAKLGLPSPGQTEADPSYRGVADYIARRAPAGDSWGYFLESGCGNGQLALLVARRKKSLVLGIDACLEACDQARRLFDREGEDGLFVVGDLRHLPFRTGSLGYIFGWGSLEHFPDTHRAVEEVYRTLRPGGRCNHSVPAVSVCTFTYFQLWGNIPELPVIKPLAYWFHHKLLKGRHLQYGYEKSFTLGGLRRYFSRAGFQTIRLGRPDNQYIFERPPWEWLRRLARWLSQFRPFWIFAYVEADR